ncbi:MAG: 50S ribosomal protein L29 [Gammaproteobacteria bacterium]|nr:50S ribosomal protein L29 [Gammaproteobacteria bacterium]
MTAASEYRTQSTEELRENLVKLRRSSFNLRMQKASDQLGQPHLLRETRREIARIKTLLSERERQQPDHEKDGGAGK